MVKADAYGHGLLEVARSLESVCDFLGVARMEEARALREGDIGEKILVCSDLLYEAIGYAVENGVTLTASSAQEIEVLAEQAKEKRRPQSVHIKVDSGMNRLGVKSLKELSSMIRNLKKAPFVQLEGIYTHFADCTDQEFTDEQFKRFMCFVDAARQTFPEIIAHCASSAAIFADRKYHLDMVRPGINLYGYLREGAQNRGVLLRPAMQVFSGVIAVKRARKGESVGYSRTYVAPEEITYAVVGAGYGDGLKRALSNKGKVAIGGRLCDVIGNICMDAFMARIAGGAMPGDEVLLFSDEAQEELSFEHNSALCGTICYELLTSFTARAKREYVK